MTDKKSTEIENTELVIKKAFAFPVPPRTSSAGYRAADLSKTPIWSGQLRVVSSGGKCTILLEHVDKDGLFAACPIENKQTVEPVSDSSRYFVLRISDGKGRHAFIGLGFAKREEAFDFKVSLQDFENQSSAEVRAEQYLSSIPDVDLKIPEGGSIRVSLGGKVPDKKRTEREKSIDKGKVPVLAPPPAQGQPKPKTPKKKESISGPLGGSGNGDAIDLLGAFPSLPTNTISVPNGASTLTAHTTFNAFPTSNDDPFSAFPSTNAVNPAQSSNNTASSGWVTF